MKLQKHLALLLGCSLILSTCILPAPKASAAKIKLNKKKLTLEVKQSYTLKLKNCKKKIKWSSSKKKVATVSAKGKVKAKKAGKTTITAKVGKKKYTCKVTVKKASSTKVSPAPKNTQAPQPTATTQAPLATSTPSVSTNPSPTETPELSPEELAENVSVERTFFPEHILLTVTNNNSVWLESVIVTYEYYNLEENAENDSSEEDAEGDSSENGAEIIAGYGDLSYLEPGVSQYISIPISTSEITNNPDTKLFLESIEVTDSDLVGIYSNQSNNMEIEAEDVDYETGSMALLFKNHSSLDVKGNYLVQFYDANNTLLDVEAGNIDLFKKGQAEEYIDVPEQCAAYQIQKYSAGFEEVDDTTLLAKGVIATVDQQLEDCLVIKVTNGNTQWLKSVDVDYEFYDADDDFLFSDIGSLASMGPGESQYLVIEVDASDMEEIDLDYSVATISLEMAEPNLQYQYATVTASIGSGSDIMESEGDDENAEYDEDEGYDEDMEDINEESYTITFTNDAALPVDGSYIIYFRDSNGDIVSATQDIIFIPANDSYSVTLDMPMLSDQNNEEILLSTPQEDDIQIFAHSYAETEGSENQ